VADARCGARTHAISLFAPRVDRRRPLRQRRHPASLSEQTLNRLSLCPICDVQTHIQSAQTPDPFYHNSMSADGRRRTQFMARNLVCEMTKVFGRGACFLNTKHQAQTFSIALGAAAGGICHRIARHTRM
jgi:hypothetical protein